MAIDRNALEEARIDLRRFINDNGDPVKCWDALEMVLKPFNCVVKQHKGKYYITNFHELNSPLWEFDWDTLTDSESYNPIADTVKSIQDFKFRGTFMEEKKVKPFKAVNGIMYTKAFAEDVTGRDLSRWFTVWARSFFSTTISADGTTLLINSGSSTTNAGQSNQMWLSAPFSLAKTSSTEYIKVEFDIKLDSLLSDPVSGPSNDISYSVFLKIEIQQPNGTWVEADIIPVLYNYWFHYTSTEKPGYLINTEGPHNVRFSFVPSPANPGYSWSSMSSSIKDIKISRTDKTVFDRGFYQSLNTNAKTEYKPEMHVADGAQITLLGALLKYDESSQTWQVCDKWNTYGGNEGIKLVDIYARNILNNRARYKNFLRATIIDREDVISMNNIVVIDGRYYVFLSFEKSYRLGQIKADLLELITTQQSYQPLLIKTLNTINGKIPEQTT